MRDRKAMNGMLQEIGGQRQHSEEASAHQLSTL
jgi:hypothetical protein